MKKTCIAALLVVLTAASLKAQDFRSLDPGALFQWLELYERSRVVQSEREAKVRAEQERYREMKDEVDDYNDCVEILNQWQKLADLKYKQLQLKYVSNIQDVKLDSAIRALQKELLRQTGKLK